jgi:hypothetical protein
MKTYGGAKVKIHALLDLGTRWRWVVSFTLRPLYPRGKTPAAIRQEAEWVPERMRMR